MSKKISFVLVVLMAASMLLTACQPTPTAEPTKAPEPTKAAEPTKAPEATKAPAAEATKAPETAAKFKVCQVTDMGGIDDKSFNATAWKGAEDAKAQLGVDAKYLESNQQTDYEKNINAFLEEKCDLIVTVGFLLGDATKAAAEKYPDQKFAIVDFTYDPAIKNVRGSVYQIDQATFLAGYLAAGTTKTGKVGTYGGLQIPSVTAFMDGFYLGVQKYNEVHSTKVEVLGWDPKAQKGLFTGDFSNLDNGKKTTEALLDEGADIVMPVAGPVGQGTLSALRERKTGMMIGVDTDWSAMYTDYQDIILASATKYMDKWVVDTTKLALDGKFKGENYSGTLENGGVDLALGAAFKDKIPADLAKEIDGLKADIIAGKITTAAAAQPAAEATKNPEAANFKLCQVTDMGGIDDKSFNATAWKGAEDAKAQLGVQAKYLESNQQTDYEKNINAFLEEKCNLIVTVGFLLGDATKAAAEKNPDQKFAIVDFAYSPAIKNVRDSVYQIDQATFLAGYLAAGTTKTGKVGTYGGLQIPSVTAFMDGFYMGVQKYNEVHSTKVEVLGWDPKAQKGLFTGDFSNLDNGKKTTEALLDEGADIVMPVAGPVGQGTLSALRERKTGMMIGVDTDWSAMYTDYQDIILASATKYMDKWVMDTTQLALDGKFKGENYSGTLENGGVDLALGAAFKDKIPADLAKEIDGLKSDIIAGKQATLPK